MDWILFRCKAGFLIELHQLPLLLSHQKFSNENQLEKGAWV
jgi:hypothetical protein